MLKSKSPFFNFFLVAYNEGGAVTRSFLFAQNNLEITFESLEKMKKAIQEKSARHHVREVAITAISHLGTLLPHDFQHPNTGDVYYAE